MNKKFDFLSFIEEKIEFDFNDIREMFDVVNLEECDSNSTISSNKSKIKKECIDENKQNKFSEKKKKKKKKKLQCV